MSEDFKAHPSWIAGAGTAVKTIGGNASDIAKFVEQYCPVAPEGFGGKILDPLTGPFQVSADATRARHSGIAYLTLATANQLNRAAWTYHDKDQQTQASFDRMTTTLADGIPGEPGSGASRPFTAYPGAEKFELPNAISVDPPSAAPPELADLIAETTGVVGDVNEAIKNVTRMAGSEINLLEKAVAPVTANWNELRRIGECYKVAGNAMEQSGLNLDYAVGQVGPHWDGRAAVAFEDWARRQSAAMKWEGPVGRVISDVLTMVADQIREGVRLICEKLRDFVASYVDFRSTKEIFKQLVKKIPVIGTALEILDLARKIWQVVDLVTGIVQRIEDLRNRVMELLQFLADPVNKTKEWVVEKLEPFTSRASDVAQVTALAADVDKITDVDRTLDRPQHSYDPGHGNQPWENAG